MIRRLRLKNFKPFADTTEIRLAPITLIYGPNSGGKSSLIQSLLLLRQTLSRDGAARLIPRGQDVDLGSFESLIHKHDRSRTLTCEVEFARLRRRRKLIMQTPDRYSRVVELAFTERIVDATRAPELSRICLQLNDNERLAMRAAFTRFDSPSGTAIEGDDEQDPDQSEYRLDDDSATSVAAYLYERELEYQRSRSRRPRGPRREMDRSDGVEAESVSMPEFLGAVRSGSIWSRYGLPGKIRFGNSDQGNFTASMRHDIFTSITSELIELFQSMSYLGPLRCYPSRHYLTMSNAHGSVGRQGEYMAEVLFQQAEVVSQVNHWFAQCDIPYDLRIESIGNEVTGTLISIVLTDRRLSLPVSPSDVGFGIGQLMPILVEGCVSEDRVLCVEQPEIHLHPRLQAELGDFFISSAGLDKRSRGVRQRAFADVDGRFDETVRDQFEGVRNQWIVETHSETLMLRLQRKIREGLLDHDAVSVLYVKPAERGSQVLPLRLDKLGNFIDEWPDGFFEEGFNEMFTGEW